MLPLILCTVTLVSVLCPIFGETNFTKLEKTNWIHDWEAPDEIKFQFVYYLSGYDDENRAILVVEMGKWDTLTVVREGGEKMRNLQNHFTQLVERIGEGYFRRSANESGGLPPNDEVILLVDYDGFSVKQMLSPANLKFVIGNLSKLEKYQAKIAFGFFINASAIARQAILLLQPVLGTLLQRIEVYGTQTQYWMPRILKKIPRDQLHPAYGGTKGFSPVTVYG